MLNKRITLLILWIKSSLIYIYFFFTNILFFCFLLRCRFIFSHLFLIFDYIFRNDFWKIYSKNDERNEISKNKNIKFIQTRKIENWRTKRYSQNHEWKQTMRNLCQIQKKFVYWIFCLFFIDCALSFHCKMNCFRVKSNDFYKIINCVICCEKNHREIIWISYWFSMWFSI